MKRFEHVITRNTAVTRPENVIFFDTETIARPQTRKLTLNVFRLGVACFWRHRRDGKPDTLDWIEFTDPQVLWDWVVRNARSHTVLYLVAHNVGFDLITSGCFPALAQRGWIFRMIYERGHTAILKWSYPTKRLRAHLDGGGNVHDFKGQGWQKSLVAVDNCNLFDGKLELWGDNLALPKMKMPKYTEPNAVWMPYCRRDVEIMVALWQDWLTFLDVHNMGTFRVTLAGQAFTAFRHAYMDHSIRVHTDVNAVELERAAYVGGRTEPFWVGHREDGPFYLLDVSSMYPHVMQVNHFPTRLKSVVTAPTLAQLKWTLAHHGAIADVLLDTPVNAFAEPGWSKHVYPTGEFRTALTTPELNYALENGWIKEIAAMASYAMRPIFRSYVGRFYELKQYYEHVQDPLHRRQVKLLLNALYGKFGQRGYDDRLIGQCDLAEYSVSEGRDMDKHLNLTIYHVAGSVIEARREGEGFNSFVAIAAHVTAYARMYLWYLIQKAGYHNVFYCDTDSLIVNQAGLDNLSNWIHPDRLGHLKNEGTSDTLTIRAPKDYDWLDSRVIKGVSKTAKDLGKNTFEQEAWHSLKWHLSHGRVDAYVTETVRKTLSYEVDWGEKGADGWITPYTRGVSPLSFL